MRAGHRAGRIFTTCFWSGIAVAALWCVFAPTLTEEMGGGCFAGLYYTYEQGWPWVWRETAVSDAGVNWWNWQENTNLETKVLYSWLVADIMVAGLICAGAAFRVRQAWQEKFSFQFSLRYLCLLTLAVSLLCGDIASRLALARKSSTVRKNIASLGLYEDTFRCKYGGPLWLSRFYSPVRNWECFQAIDTVAIYSVFLIRDEDVNGEVWNRFLQESRDLRLESVIVYDDAFNEIVSSDERTIALLQALAPSYVASIRLVGPRLHNEVTRELPRFASLKSCDLSGTSIDDASVECLLRCRSLEELDICGSKITARGMRQLLELPNLKSLAVGEQAVDEDIKTAFEKRGIMFDVFQGR